VTIHRWQRPSSLLAALALLALGACKPPSESFASTSTYVPTTWLPGTWSVVWSDEFEGAAGTLADPTKWTYQVGGDGWGNKELQDYTDSINNAALDGQGHLVITARAEVMGMNDYTSARLTTQGHFSRAYGRFEARMRLAAGDGLWPAFWILGDDFPTAGWPTCGEMDIAEEKGNAPDIVSGSVHGPQENAAIDFPATRFVTVAGGSDADFHVYAVEWDPDKIVFLFDEMPYMQINPADRPRWVYDHPFFIIVNLAVGGQFPGAPTAATIFPTSITVDYVRVSERAGDGGVDGSPGDAGPDDGGASEALGDAGPPADGSGPADAGADTDVAEASNGE
jgi:beta-glucanase (GH16 family)